MIAKVLVSMVSPFSGNRQLYYGIANEKTAVCMCTHPDCNNNTLYLSSSHADAYIVNGDKNKVPLPASVDVTSSESQRSCIYLILVSTRRYQISGYFIAGLKNTSFSFPIQVASISPFNVTKKDEGKKYMKTYLGETVQFISRISKPIGSVLFQWDFGDRNVTQIEKQDGTLTISHAYEKAGCFFAMNSWLFLSDNQTVERFALAFQIEVLQTRPASDMLKGEENYLQNGTDASNFREVLMKGRSIGYVGVVKKSLSFYSNETHISGSNVFKYVDVFIVLGPQSIVVYKHFFDVMATVFPPLPVFYNFTTPAPNKVVKSSPLSNRATIYTGSLMSSQVKVTVTEIGATTSFDSVMRIYPLKDLSCFNVEYRSFHGFQFGKPVLLMIATCGLIHTMMHMDMICSDEEIFIGKPHLSVNTTTSVTLNPGNNSCLLEASITGAPGALQKYSAPGVNTRNRQYILVYGNITNVSAIFNINGFRFTEQPSPSGHYMTVEMESDGAGANFEIAYKDKNISVSSAWNQTAKRSMAKHEIKYKGSGRYNLSIKAKNPFSNKMIFFDVQHFDGKNALT